MIAEARPEGARPQYVRVADRLRARIEAGDYAVGALMPTEGDLRGEFSISRHTVREALRLLSDEGLIRRRQGSGSRVIAAAPHQSYVHAMRSLDQLFQYASDTRFVISEIGVRTPDEALFPDVADAEWLVIRGLRLERAEDLPICHSTVLVARPYAGVAEELGEGTGAIYRRIEERFGVEVSVVEQDITAGPLPPEAAAALGEAPAAPAVRVRRRYLAADGAVMIASVNFHPAERFSYAMRLRREDGRPRSG